MSEAICPDDGVQTVDLSVVADAERAFQPGLTIDGRYRLERQLGSGGMGSVYVATQLNMQREVAIKMLRKDLAIDRHRLKRFFHEARSASALKHPNIVEIYDFGVDPVMQSPFIAMALIEGVSLRTVFDATAPLDVRRACGLCAQIAKGLTEAHDKGLVHRDLKPDNVMITRFGDGDEHAEILDFGIAKSLDDDENRLTVTGASVGTPAYMSPEQISAATVDGRSDLYSLGCILYEALTAETPFSANEGPQMMLHHVNDPAPELEGDFPDALVRLQSSLLAKSPDEVAR